MMTELNYRRAIKIAEGIYWVGYYDENARLHCNPYVILDGDESIVIDPGSVPHFQIVARKILSIVDLRRIKYVVLSHQDPDLCGSLPVLEKLINRDDLELIAHRKAAIYINYYGITSPFFCPEDNGYRLILQSGRELRFIFAPYTHAPGTIMTYDVKTKILFSGDIFAGMLDKWDLFARSDYVESVVSYARIHFPPGDSMKINLAKIESLDISMIAPQHGAVIEREDVSRYIETLKNTECGIDIREGAE